MKKQLTILASILAVLLTVCGLALAQSQSVNQLPVTTTPAATDKLYIVTNPASSPASRAVTVANLLGNNGIQTVNVKAFGALGNGFVVTDGAMSSISNTSTLTCSTSHPFTAAMVGMRIDVNQAGALASSYYNNLSGTIVSYISAFQVTVSFTCLHMVSGAQVVVTSDDTTAISNAKTAAGAHGTVWFPRGVYGITAQLSPLSEQVWAGEGIGVSVVYQMGVVRPTSGSAYNGINIADGVHDVTLRDFSLRGTNLQAASVDARLSQLMRPDDQLELDYDFLRRVADYAGFPVPSKDEMVSQWREHDARCAQLMLSTDCGVVESAVQTLLEDSRYEGTEEEALRVLGELSQLREAVKLDMESGKPGDRSEAAKELRTLMMQ